MTPTVDDIPEDPTFDEREEPWDSEEFPDADYKPEDELEDESEED